MTKRFLYILPLLSILAIGCNKAQAPTTSDGPAPTPATAVHAPAPVDYAGKWAKAEFPKNYTRSTDVAMPTEWAFSCCGDTDSYSLHTIFPDPTNQQSDTGPLVRVIDFVLQTCPDNSLTNCELTELSRAKPADFFKSLNSHLVQNTTIAQITNLRTIENPYTRVPATTYTGAYVGGQEAELHLLEGKKGVIAIAFVKADDFSQPFKHEFLLRQVEKLPVYGIRSLDLDTVSVTGLPEDVIPGQIDEVYEAAGVRYAMARMTNMNFPVEGLRGQTPKWHGVLSSTDQGRTWTEFFSIQNPPDPSGDAPQGIIYNPVAVFAEDKTVYVDIANTNGAGSGEGQLIRFASSDGGTTWKRTSCLYLIYEQYHVSGQLITPYTLKPTTNCVY